MPEEINRVVADHLSDLLLCPSPTAVANLAAEGITRNVHLVGDVMLDVLNWAEQRADASRSALHNQSELKDRSYLCCRPFIAAKIPISSNVFQAS